MPILWFIGGLILGCAIGWLLHWERQAKAYSARSRTAAQTRRERKAKGREPAVSGPEWNR